MAEEPLSGRVPVPDPTSLTTDAFTAATAQWRRDLEALQRLLEIRIAGAEADRDRLRGELAGARQELSVLLERLRAEFHRDIKSSREILETRLEAMDRATERAYQNANIVQSAVEEKICHLANRHKADIKGVHEAVRHLQELSEARLDAMDKATSLLATNVAVIGDQIEKSSLSLKEIIDTRLAGMDEATKLLATNVDKVPYAILQEAGNLKAFIMSRVEEVAHVGEERFTGIGKQFAANELALNAALAAQKEAAAEQNKSNTLAISKSEQATKETIQANANQTGSGLAALSRELADLKERFVRVESGGVATAAAKTDRRLDTGQILTAVSVVVAALFLAVALYTALHK